jgi:hypothetical protein
MARGYYLNPGSDAVEQQPMRSIDHVAPAGSINSSARDMAQWVLFQLGRGEIDGRRIAPSSAVEETWKEHSKMSPAIAYGLGWMIADWEGERTITHAGGIDGFTADVTFLPDRNAGVVVLTNLFASPAAQQARDLVLRGLFRPLPQAAPDTPDAPPAEDFDRFLGTYVANFGPFNDAEMPVTVQNGRLAVFVPGQTTYELLAPNAQGLRPFALTSAIAIEFNQNAQGEVYSLTFHQGGMKFEVFRQGAQAPVEIDLADVREYLGVYRIDAGGPQIDVDVRIQNNRLAVNVPGQMVYELMPPDDEGWWVMRVTDAIRVRFDRDEDGQVVSMTQRQSGNDIVMNRVGNAPDADSLPTAAELMELIAPMLDQNGSLKSLDIRATVNAVHQGLSGSHHLIVDAQGRVMLNSDLGDGRIARTWIDGKTGVSRVYALREDLTLSEKMARGVLLASPLFWTRDWRTQFDKVLVTDFETEDGQSTFIVRCIKEGHAPVVVRIDADTGLPRTIAITTPNIYGMDVAMEVTLSDWREVEGVQIAHRQETSIDLAGRTVSQINSIEVNEPVTDATFAPTPR